MDVRLPDGTILKNVPDGTTKAQLMEKLSANGYDLGQLTPVETTATRQNVLPESAPAWAKEHPDLYGAAVKARQMLGPTIEAGGAIAGGVVGTAGATPGLGTLAGAGLGYGIAKEALKGADVYLGLEKPRQGTEVFTEPARNVLEGATYEAGGRVAAPIIAKGVGKLAEGVTNVAGKLVDIRNIPTQKAAKMARESIGGNELTDVINALRSAPANATPAQALADAGLNQPTTQALLKRAAQRDPKFFTDLLKTEDFQTVNALAKIAGGESQTSMRSAQEVAKEELNKLLVPRLSTELEAANIAGKLKPKLEGQAQRLAEAAANKVQDVRRFEAAGDRATKAATEQVVEKGLPSSTARYTYTGELADRAKEVAAQAADASLPFGEASRFAQAGADSLAAYGLKPLEATPIVQNLTNIARDPKLAGNSDVQRVLGRVANDLGEWTGKGGVIDAWALDSIRKNSVNAAIRDLYPGADAKQQKQLAAKVLTEVKPLLIDAIENAGGTGYRQYLTDYSKGMQKIGQTKLGAEAMALYKKSPQQFVDLVEGNNPDLVEKIFGPGSYDIAVEMSNDAMKTLKSTSKQIKTSAEMAKQATEGEQALVQLMKDNVTTIKLPNVFSIVATTTNKALDILEKKIGKATLSKLTEAAKSTDSFEALLNTLPATERSAVLKTIRDPKLWEGAKEAGKRFTGAATIGVNALSNEPNQNALAK